MSNHFKNRDRERLRHVAKAIKRVASMETCVFREQNIVKVSAVKEWAMWFTEFAQMIEDVMEGYK